MYDCSQKAPHILTPLMVFKDALTPAFKHFKNSNLSTASSSNSNLSLQQSKTIISNMFFFKKIICQIILTNFFKANFPQSKLNLFENSLESSLTLNFTAKSKTFVDQILSIISDFTSHFTESLVSKISQLIELDEDDEEDIGSSAINTIPAFIESNLYDFKEQIQKSTDDSQISHYRKILEQIYNEIALNISKFLYFEKHLLKGLEDLDDDESNLTKLSKNQISQLKSELQTVYNFFDKKDNEEKLQKRDENKVKDYNYTEYFSKSKQLIELGSDISNWNEYIIEKRNTANMSSSVTSNLKFGQITPKDAHLIYKRTLKLELSRSGVDADRATLIRTIGRKLEDLRK